jgi:AP-3 complex subunit mu
LCDIDFQIENVCLEIPFPKSILNVTLTASQGKYSFDPVTKVMTWDIGKIDPAKLPNIRGNVSITFINNCLLS